MVRDNIKFARTMADNLRAVERIDDEQYRTCQEQAAVFDSIADELEELIIWREKGVKNCDCMACKHSGGTNDYCDRPQDETGLIDCEFEPLDGLKEGTDE